MIFREAGEHVLREAGKPLHFREITRRALDAGLIETEGKTPWDTMNAQIGVHINDYGNDSPFVRIKPNVYALREWVEAGDVQVVQYKVRGVYLPQWADLRALLPALDGVGADAPTRLMKAIQGLTGDREHPVEWTDPDEWIAERLDGDERELANRIWSGSKGAVNPRYLRSPLSVALHYDLLVDEGGELTLTDAGRDFIAQPNGDTVRLLDEREGLIRALALVAEQGPASSGDLLEPWMAWLEGVSRIGSESSARSALTSRLANLHARDLISRAGTQYEITDAGLAWLGQEQQAPADGVSEVSETDLDLWTLIQRQKQQVRQELREHLHQMDPYDFEHVVRQLLERLGYEDVEVTKASHDKGVDVVGKIDVGISTVREVVQVKRLKRNVHRRVLDQLRGSLHRFDAMRGTIITTSGFSKGTQDAAFEAGAAPITLIDGDRLVELLVEYGIGIRRQQVALWKFAPETLPGAADDELVDDVGE